eukprot:2303624-Amphidinium_carterae.1
MVQRTFISLVSVIFTELKLCAQDISESSYQDKPMLLTRHSPTEDRNAIPCLTPRRHTSTKTTLHATQLHCLTSVSSEGRNSKNTRGWQPEAPRHFMQRWFPQSPRTAPASPQTIHTDKPGRVL